MKDQPTAADQAKPSKLGIIRKGLVEPDDELVITDDGPGLTATDLTVTSTGDVVGTEIDALGTDGMIVEFGTDSVGRQVIRRIIVSHPDGITGALLRQVPLQAIFRSQNPAQTAVSRRKHLQDRDTALAEMVEILNAPGAWRHSFPPEFFVAVALAYNSLVALEDPAPNKTSATSTGTHRSRGVSRRARGEGQIRRRADGRWEGRFTTPDGHRRSVFGRTKDEVAKQLREATSARDHGTLVAPGNETMHTYLGTWLTGVLPSLRPMTFQSYESVIRTQLDPRLGRIRLTALRPHHVQAMHSAMLAEGLSPKYVRNIHGVLHRALDRAVQWRQLATNPADAIDLPPKRTREMTALDSDQARAVLDSIADDPLCALWALMLVAGLRQGELLALRWRDVDLDAGRLAVTGSSVRLTKRARDLLGVTDSEPLRGEPKTRRSRRVVELPSLAVDALRRHRDAAKVVTVDGRVFTTPDGRVLRVPTVYNRWHGVLERAGVPLVRPHDARHTTATLMLAQGVHPKLVSEMLGHATVAITLDLYSHATPTMHREAANTLDALLRTARS
jgi:integrase